jgi:hypothetical protein
MLQERDLEQMFEVRSSEADAWVHACPQRLEAALSKLRAL